jgi:hypothetical protein
MQLIGVEGFEVRFHNGLGVLRVWGHSHRSPATNHHTITKLPLHPLLPADGGHSRIFL